MERRTLLRGLAALAGLALVVVVAAVGLYVLFAMSYLMQARSLRRGRRSVLRPPRHLG